jgi:hypothetical protein
MITLAMLFSLLSMPTGLTAILIRRPMKLMTVLPLYLRICKHVTLRFIAKNVNK